MDYDVALQATCPIEVVREVRRTDMTSLAGCNVVDLAFDAPVGPGCFDAVIA